LGAGKTTLIRKLLREAFKGERVVVVENDFGAAGADASLLRADGAAVTELSSGCICCSLSGDLIKALRRLIGRYTPAKIIIEPSGVGKLSDVAAACADNGLRALAEVKRKLTVVDAARCDAYFENFGAFFTDQIEHADAVLLSHIEERPDRLEAARDLIRSLNARAELFDAPWESLRAESLLAPPRTGAAEAHGAGGRHCDGDHHHDGHSPGGLHCGEREHGAEARRRGEHEHGAGGRHCDGDHHHDGHGPGAHGLSAEALLDTVTIRTERVFSADELRARVSRMEQGAAGEVLRAKGVLRGTDGRLNLQYIPGDTRIEPCAADEGDALCVIGRNLNGPGLAALFEGVL
jgi:G3E family GTPase